MPKAKQKKKTRKSPPFGVTKLAPKEYERAIWDPYTLMIVIEHRKCKHCGRSYTTPSGVVHARYKRRNSTATKIAKLPSDMYLDPLLPRAHEHVHISIPRCHQCFIPTSNPDPYIPGIEPPKYNYNGVQSGRLLSHQGNSVTNALRAKDPTGAPKPKIKPLQLSDF